MTHSSVNTAARDSLLREKEEVDSEFGAKRACIEDIEKCTAAKDHDDGTLKSQGRGTPEPKSQGKGTPPQSK